MNVIVITTMILLLHDQFDGLRLLSCTVVLLRVFISEKTFEDNQILICIGYSKVVTMYAVKCTVACK